MLPSVWLLALALGASTPLALDGGSPEDDTEVIENLELLELLPALRERALVEIFSDVSAEKEPVPVRTDRQP